MTENQSRSISCEQSERQSELMPTALQHEVTLVTVLGKVTLMVIEAESSPNELLAKQEYWSESLRERLVRVEKNTEVFFSNLLACLLIEPTNVFSDPRYRDTLGAGLALTKHLTVTLLPGLDIRDPEPTLPNQRDTSGLKWIARVVVASAGDP